MTKGKVYPAESIITRDAQSGRRVRQITAHLSIHHQPFFYVPAYDAAMNWLFFVSHRHGGPQIFAEERATGKLIQLTDRDDLAEWSLHPSADGRYVYFTAGAAAWRLDLHTFHEERIADLPAELPSVAGSVGADLGTTSLSGDDQWWAIPIGSQDLFQLLVIDVSSGEKRTIVQSPSLVCHPQFHPDNAALLRYAGPHDARLWVIGKDGGQPRLAYHRDQVSREWITHETWRPQTNQILATSWPRGVIAVDIDTGEHRWVTRFNAWHPMVNRGGTRMVTDTRNPDLGLHLFDIGAQHSMPSYLCRSDASSLGDHWNADHCVYDDGPVSVYAPQHTHPHPSFSPDERFVVFTTDRSGFAQVCEVSL